MNQADRCGDPAQSPFTLAEEQGLVNRMRGRPHWIRQTGLMKMILLLFLWEIKVCARPYKQLPEVCVGPLGTFHKFGTIGYRTC